MEHLLGIDAGGWLDKCVTLAVAVVIAVMIERVVVRLMHRLLDASDLPSASLFINIGRAVIWVLALLSVLRPVFGVDPAGFVAALGVVSIAVSLGMQDTISNIIGGISLMLSKAVQPGDYISVGDVTGEVTDVNWRSTTVMMRGGAQEVIPNSVLSKTALTRITPWAWATAVCPSPWFRGRTLTPCRTSVAAWRRASSRTCSTLPSRPTSSSPRSPPTARRGEVRLHVRRDVVCSTAQDRLARALSGMPWLASCV